MAFVIRCPECRKTFPWNSKEKMPARCPLPDCDYVSNVDPNDDGVVMPFISKAKNRAVDDMYRAMERGSEHRMRMAAEATGLPVSELSDMKLTNMKDNAHQGEASAMPPPRNAVTERMDQMRARGMAVGFGSNGAETSMGVQTGPYPNAGAHAMQRVREMHAAAGNATSERPALETLQPGYRRRS